jgi:hypothetical protein
MQNIKIRQVLIISFPLEVFTINMNTSLFTGHLFFLLRIGNRIQTFDPKHMDSVSKTAT